MPPIPCPACSRFLPESPTSCPGCHLPLTGPDAARLWQVDQTLATLQRERTTLISSLRSQGAGAAAQRVPQRTSAAPPDTVVGQGTPVRPRPPRHPP